jgi:hypothetical protein
MTPFSSARPSEQARADLRTFSWRAALVGVVIALGVQTLLITLGLATGITTVDSGSVPGGIRTASTSAGIWYLTGLLIATFCGGLAAGIGSREARWTRGILEGLVIWSVTLVLAGLLLARSVGQVLSLAGGVVGSDMHRVTNFVVQLPGTRGQGITPLAAGASIAAARLGFLALLLSAASAIGGEMLGPRLFRKRFDRDKAAGQPDHHGETDPQVSR